MNDREKNIVISTAKLVLRDTGEADYIMARSAFRMKLYPQFLWGCHQAVEKILKSILVLNLESARSYRHNLFKLMEAVSALKWLEFNPPEEIINFITYLDGYGHNRYRERMVKITGDELARLDRTIWNLRQYAIAFKRNPKFYMRSELEKNYLDNKPQMNLKHNPFQIVGGFLEKVLNEQVSNKARENLVWNNIFYTTSSRKNHTIKTFLHCENSIQIVFKKDLSLIREYIRFSSADERFFNDNPSLF